MTARAVALEFVAAINAGDVTEIERLMAPDHEFIDSLGATVRGRAEMSSGWRAYLDLFPDYRIDIEDCLCRGETVLLWGWAGGTLRRPGVLPAESAWRVPAAWRAGVAGPRVRLWQVFADNSPVYELLRKAGTG